MPQTPHVERHFTGSATVRDLVIGMSDGLTVPFALAAGLSGAVDDTRIIVTAGLAEIAAGSIAISASVGITLLALAIFGYVKGHFTGAQLPANGIDRRIGRRGGILDRQSDLMSRVRRNIITSSLSGLAASSDPTRPPEASTLRRAPEDGSGVRAGSGP